MESNLNAKAQVTDAGRAKVGEWIAGCDAVRNGLFNAFFIEVGEDRSGVMVTPENVDKTEANICEAFGKLYPELFPDRTGLTEGHERRASEIYQYPDLHSHSEQGVYSVPSETPIQG